MDHSDQQLEDVETFGAETSISLVPPDDYEPDKEQDTSDSWDASFGLAFDTRDSDRLDDLAGLATANFALPGDRFGFGWKEGLKVAQHGLGRRSPSRERSRSPDEAESSFSRDVHSPAALAESLDFTAKSHVDSLDNPSVILSSDVTHEISPIVNGPNSHKKTALKDVIATDGLDFSITSVEQEGKILSRIAELRKVGKWEDSRIPKCVVAPPFSKGIVNFTKEVTWVATLIAREKKQKMIMAKKIAYAVKRWHEKREEQKRKQEREERLRMRKVAKHIGSLVMAWWQELGKVAQLKQREEIEIQKKKIRDLHLRHLMDQTEEFSSRMAQGLSRTSTQLAIADSAEPVEEELDPQDKEFEVEEDSEAVDEEDTISDEEAQEGEQQQSEDALMEEADLPIEELLKRYSGYEETVLAAAEAPSVNKRRRTMSRNPDFEYEIEKKKKRDDDLSVLVQPSNGEEPSMSRTENASFDDKVKKREEAMEKLKPKGNSLSSTEVVTKVPFLLRGSLREYQHVGLDWLVSLYHNQMNGILADEMGLGKTIQTIAFIAHLASAENNWGPHLVIVPTSVILNWELEFKRWCPGLIIKTYYGSRKQRLDLRTGWTKPDAFHVCITSYKVATQDYSSFRRMRWQYLILDEAQAIKNYKSQRWTRIAEFPSHRRLLLTGTPMQNSLEEVWALLHFLAPELFENLNMFQQLFSNPMTAMSEGKKPQDNVIVKQLHTVLRPFILRRMKAEVETQLPKKFEHVVQCRLSKRQRNLYDDYMSRTKTIETLATGNYLSVINILMQLRKVCNHPNLFEERPVLSPMVVAPIPIKLPGLIFDVLNSTRDPPYMKEVSTTIRLPFWHSPSGLFSTDSSTLLSLVPPDDKLAPLREEGKEIAPAEISYPQDFPAVMDSIELTMTDMMAGTPFVRDDERLCTDLCTHSPAPPVKAFSTVATVHTGRVKRSLKNGTGPRTPMRNGTKKLRSNVVEVNPEAPVRISSKRFTDDVVPLLLKQQREDHYDVFVASNRRKCELKPLILEDVLNFVKLKNGGKGDRRTPLDVAETGYGQCLEAQKEVLQEGPFRKGYSALEDLTEMGASVGTCLRRRDVSFWLESMSLAYAPVMTSPPILRVFNMPRRVLEKMDFLEKQLMPIVKHVSEVLHPVQRLRVLKFPETRLIQYDCGKLQALDDLLKGLFAGSHRVLIFTQMTKVLDILEIFLTYHGYKYLRLDGTTGVEMRQTLMDRFNRDKRYFVFILSTRSGGVGVNLTGADTVVFYDSDWNPTMDAQAQDRCHRIGQTRDVHIYRLISEYTVEENIHMKASQKKYLGQLAIEQGDFTTAVLKKENFKDIFGLKEGDLPATSTEEQSSHEASLEVVNEEAAIEAAIAEAEDADDADAARKAKAEAKVEEEEEDDDDDQPRFKAIQKLLAPIQCYGVQYMENHVLDQDVMEELEQTREEVERKKKEWELNRLEIAKAEKIRAAEEVCEPYVVTKTLMDPKFYEDIFTGENPEFVQDIDIPMFHFRDVASPSLSDKENNVKDYLMWGPHYRNPPPETQLPSSKRKSGKRLRKDKQLPDPLMSKSSKRKKLDHLAPLNFDPMIGKGLRLPPHMGLPRDLYGSSYDIPDTLAGLENASADWKPFEDWQIVTTSSVLQNIPPSATNPLPIPTTGRTSFDLVAYVSSTSNLRYRIPMDCQVRVKTLRMREDKEAPVDVGPTPTKKKKKSKAEDQILDKAPGSIPKKVAVAVQEDGGRSRTHLYKDLFGSFRNQNFNSPLVKRDMNAYQRNPPAPPGSAGVGLPDIPSNVEDLITPLAALKKRQERGTVSRAFLQETTLKWAQALNVAVDLNGQLASVSMLSPSPNKSILQQTLQMGVPRTPNTLGPMMPRGPLTPGTPGSMQSVVNNFVLNPNVPQQRPVFVPNNNVPSPVTPQSSSPLPSLSTSGINQYMGNMASAAAASTSAGISGTLPTVSTALQQQAQPVNVMYAPTGPRPPMVVQQNGVPQQQVQLGVQQKQNLIQVKEFLTKLCAAGQPVTVDSVNFQKLKEFLMSRGIAFNESQIADLLKMFAGASRPMSAISPTGTGPSLPVSASGQGGGIPGSPVNVSSAPMVSTIGNVQKPPPSPFLINNTQVQSMGTPVTSGPTITAIAPRPIMVNNQAGVRLQAVPARANGPGTVTVNFPPSSQASTSVPAIRTYQKRAPTIAVRMTAPIGNGPTTSSVSQVMTPVTKGTVSQVSSLANSSTKAPATISPATVSTSTLQWTPQQFNQVLSLSQPTGTHIVTPAPNGVYVRRNVAPNNVVLVPSAITPTTATISNNAQPTTLQFQMVSNDGKPAEQMAAIVNHRSPPAGSQPEPQ